MTTPNNNSLNTIATNLYGDTQILNFNFPTINTNEMFKKQDGDNITGTKIYSTGTSNSNKITMTSDASGLINVGTLEGERDIILNTSKLHVNATGTQTDGITITSQGRVGIGVTDPQEDLELDGNIQLDTGGVQRGRVIFYDKQNNHEHAEIDGLGEGTNGGVLAFYTKQDGGSVTEKLRINNVGAIGLGGANYGTAGQVLTSNGLGNPVSWKTSTGGVSNLYTLTPNTTNASTIISQIANDFTISNTWWYEYQTNTYTNGPAHGHGNGAFVGGVLAPNGLIILVPENSTNVGIHDPIANTYTNGPAHGQGSGAFRGGVLAPNGKIILVPLNSTNVGIYDPTTNTYSNGPAHGHGNIAFQGGVLAPNGLIILVPINSTVVGIYDPTTNTYTNGPAHGQGSGAFIGGVLAPNGLIILVPHDSPFVGIYDPIANTYTNGPAHGHGNGAFTGGVLAPNGNIILVPQNSTVVGIYDPTTNTYTNGPAHGQGSGAFTGGVLAPNGLIILVPVNSTVVGIYDPTTNTYTNGPAHGRGGIAFVGGVLAPNGKIILVPFNSTNVDIYGIITKPLLNDTFEKNTLLPYFNKF